MDVIDCRGWGRRSVYGRAVGSAGYWLRFGLATGLLFLVCVVQRSVQPQLDGSRYQSITGSDLAGANDWSLSALEDDPPGRLVSSVLVSRHGDRAPQKTAPAYETGDRLHYDAMFAIDNGNWSVGYGELTAKGMLQCYQLGTWLRSRYIEGTTENRLLHATYDHEETHARSTDVDRTLVSAQGILSGLYPMGTGPEGGIEGRPELIPVHTIQYADDYLLDGSASSHCPLFKAAYKSALRSHLLYSDVLKSPLMPHGLANLSGFAPEFIASLKPHKLVKLATSLRDLRVCQRSHNVTVDDAAGAYDQALETIAAKVVEQKWDLSGLGYLGGARLLTAIGRRFDAMVDLLHNQSYALNRLHLECNAKGDDSDEIGDCPRKFILYTGHDTTIFDLRSALGLSALLPHISPFLAHLILELRQQDNGDVVVQVLCGWHDHPAAPEAGPFCGGKSWCSFKEFSRYIDRTLPRDVDSACAIGFSRLNVLHVFLVTTLILVLGFTGFYAAVTLFSRARKPEYTTLG